MSKHIDPQILQKSRAKYIALKYQKYLKERVLDVGCREKNLKKYLDKNVEYVGIDIAGDPDVHVDLEKGSIPFENNSFECVVCTDVLEHIDNIHKIFNELVRVSRKYIVISLPNNWNVVKVPVISGKSEFKQYGLPKDEPKDRHKWFFNYTEASKFILDRAEVTNCEVVSLEPYYIPDKNIIKKSIKLLLKIVFNEDRYANWFYGAVWCVLKKRQ